MSNPRSHQEHWKQLIASAREKNAAPAEAGKAEEPSGKKTPEQAHIQDSPWVTARRWYREYVTRYRYVWLAASLLLLAVCLGMAFAPDGRPKRVPVSGQVLLDDQPLTNATVMFIPQEGRSAAATVDEQGHFTLSCFGGEDGAIPGSYRIELAMTQAPSKTDPPWPVPRIYTNHQTSGLTAEITKSTRDVVIRLTGRTDEPPVPGRSEGSPLPPDDK